MLLFSKMNLNEENHKELADKMSTTELIDIINEASKLYYNTEQTLISDEVYDNLVDIYNKKSKFKYNNIGADIDDKKRNKVKLPFHMGSMNKTYSLKEFKKWVLNQNVKDYVISPKIDGTSCMICITNDNIDVYSRGNGEYGKKLDTFKTLFINDVVLTNVRNFIDKNKIERFACRGEIIISKSNFSKFNSSFKSARSMVNGLSNQKNLSTDYSNIIDYLIFEIIEPKLEPVKQFELSKQLGFKTVKYDLYSQEIIINKNEELQKSLLLDKIKTYKENYNYDIDGLIITSNNLYSIPKSGNPEYSIAFKNNGEGVLTSVNFIEWNLSKHGVLIPTIVFDKVNLGSSTVSRCTGFNGKFIFNNCLGKGAIIKVVLSGEVIPYINKIVDQSDIPQMPEVPYVWSESKVHCLVVDNNKDIIIKKIVHFMKVLGIESIGEGIIKHLYENGYDSLKKILLITYDDLIALKRIEKKMANKILDNIKSKISKPIELSILMEASLCFGNGFGIKRCIQIEKKYPNLVIIEDGIYNILNVSKDELFSLEGWSDKSITKYFNGLVKFKAFMEENNYLTIKKYDTKNPVIENNIDIKAVCITGTRDKKIIDFLKMNNIIISNSITKNVNILICSNKETTSSKIVIASKKGIPIVTSLEFKNKYKIE